MAFEDRIMCIRCGELPAAVSASRIKAIDAPNLPQRYYFCYDCLLDVTVAIGPGRQHIADKWREREKQGKV